MYMFILQPLLMSNRINVFVVLERRKLWKFPILGVTLFPNPILDKNEGHKARRSCILYRGWKMRRGLLILYVQWVIWKHN